jgi:hypothetical protein
MNDEIIYGGSIDADRVVIITVELDTVRKYRNTQEYRPVNRATCEGYEAVGDGDVIRQVLQLYHKDNPHFTGKVQVRRGDMLCFVITSLNQWLFPVSKQPEHLKRTNRLNRPIHHDPFRLGQSRAAPRHRACET